MAWAANLVHTVCQHMHCAIIDCTETDTHTSTHTHTHTHTHIAAAHRWSARQLQCMCKMLLANTLCSFSSYRQGSSLCSTPHQHLYIRTLARYARSRQSVAGAHRGESLLLIGLHVHYDRACSYRVQGLRLYVQYNGRACSYRVQQLTEVRACFSLG